jgi:2,3-bisphosphoglycerate-dependent phosphoglycerate mutase
MPKLILLRHLQSQWNLENKFTGWTDVPLSKEGTESAKEIAKKLMGFEIDKVYTSPLIRNKETVSLILEYLGKVDEDKSSSSPFAVAWVKDVPIIIDKALDERNYGKLQGLNKDEVKKQYGEEQVKLWRRSWNQAPPGGESLKDVSKRVLPFLKKYIEKDLKKGKNVLIVASHNSLRALIKYIEKIDSKDIIGLEIPTGAVIEYEFDKNLRLKSKKS